MNKPAYARGDTLVAAMHVAIPDHFHLYSNPLGPGIGKPLRLRAFSGPGVRWIAAYKSPPKRFYPEFGGWVWAYEKEATFFIKGVITDSAASVTGATAYASGLVCYTSCVPVTTGNDFEIRITDSSAGGSFDDRPSLRYLLNSAEPLDFEVGPVEAKQKTEPGALGQITMPGQTALAAETPHRWEYEPVEKKISMNFLLAVLFGFIAGIILNVMPCVLPVLGIKILSLAKAGGASRKTVLAHSLVFTGGILTVFMALAALASFAQLSWGQQFQSPWFLVSLIVLTVVFALGLFDVYVLVVPSNISNLERKSGKGFLGEYLRGMFATLLATPCSGPFLGATLAWTLTQSTVIIFLVFFSIGAGMAFPYILFSLSKTLVRLIPKPGKWMEDFKHLMGILLLGAAVYFLLGLPKDMVVSAVGFSVAIAFAVVFFFRYAPWGSSLKRNIVAGILALAIAAFGYYLTFVVIYRNTSTQAALAAERNEVQWEEFTPKLLLDAHANGRHVIVDFTANWCLNCQYNMLTVLSSKEVAELIKRKNVLALKADLTWTNVQAESLLHHLGSRSVPFFAVFPGDDPYHPIIMRDILSKRAVVKVLKGLEEK
ncbi:MAG TPA: cytochrome c biogenesis protein CcdA [Chitinivibrionales bacterium]|nr:cytochrome c biogenesis protein CcdA [Chitinivibrionales bacterium]